MSTAHTPESSRGKPTNVDPELAHSLASLATHIARTVGEVICARRSEGVTVAATKSSTVDVVTAADREAESLIVAALQRARPDDGIVGEEGTGITGSSGINWVIDPIDGTTNYLYNLPHYTVSIAATVADAHATTDGRRGIAGAVYCPRTDELFEAWEGGGARRNGVPLAISGEQDLSATLLGTGFGYTVERKREQLVMFDRILPQVRDIRRLGSAAYDICSVAAGHLDAYYERGLQPWDYAASLLIAREAGAQVCGLNDTTPPGEPLLCVGAPVLTERLRAEVLGETSEP